MPLRLAQPSPRGGSAGCEADAVLARVGGAEGEFAGVATLGVDDAVVVVKKFVDRDGDAKIRVCGEGFALGLALVLESGVVASEKRVSWR